PHHLGWSHTQGGISQLRSQVFDSRRVRVIQTSAAINPGNSGGGLYDHDGYCIGINTWTGDKRVSEGIGFAIALDTLFDLAPPPERYQLEFRIRGLRQTADDLSVVKSHLVEIALPLNYPRMPPQCRMLTPIFHPNIAPHAICIGDHWSPGEPLWSIVARI